MSGRLVWFRRDLRISDNEALLEAAKESKLLVPFSTIDPGCLQIVGDASSQTTFDLPTLGPYRARFLVEALSNLHNSLVNLGSGLHFSFKPAQTVVCDLVSCLFNHCSRVELFYNLDYGAEAEKESEAVEEAFFDAAEKAGLQADVQRFWDRTLVHPNDLPATWSANIASCATTAKLSVDLARFKLRKSPKTMTDVRKAVETQCQIRSPVASPHSLPAVPIEIIASSAAIPGSVHELYALTHSESALVVLEQLTGHRPDLVTPEYSMFPFTGGEDSAHQRLRHFVNGDNSVGTKERYRQLEDWQDVPLAYFQNRRMLATGIDNSAKLSAFLNYGCITSRQIHAELEAMKGSAEAMDGRKWLQMHLQIRDFFQFMCLKDMSEDLPLQDIQSGLEEKEDVFRQWCQGRTGFTFVDASMRELAASGFMSNRSRQNVASLLTKGLGINWRWGEALFKCLLIDYDPASNIGNWKYVGGADYDPRGSARVFKTVSQGMKYDQQATLIRRWLPELQGMPVLEAHRPWLNDGSVPGYLAPILQPSSQLRQEDQ